MGGYSLQLALIVALVTLNAILAGSEMALVSLRDSQVRRLERAGCRGRAAARLARDPNRFLATIQIGITLAGFLASATAAVSLSRPLVRPLRSLGSVAEPAAVVVVTLVLTFFTLVAGELAPKRVAMQRAEAWALAVARPLNKLATLSRPLVWLLGLSTDLVVRLSGADPKAVREQVSTEEVRDMLATQQGLSAQQRTILDGAFDIAQRTLRQIVVPRRAVITLPATLPASDAVRRLVDTGHSRAPVTGPGGIDDVAGVVHIRDLVPGSGPVGGLMRSALFLPETMRVVDALRQMRQIREHLALVVDERGAVEGIVTMEDLVEEVVGEIYDEADHDLQAVTREADGTMLIDGTFPIHDLPDVGVHLDDVDPAGYTTVAGLLLSRLGHIPTRAGERVDLGPCTAEVVEVTGRAITRIRLHPKPSNAT